MPDLQFIVIISFLTISITLSITQIMANRQQWKDFSELFQNAQLFAERVARDNLKKQLNSAHEDFLDQLEEDSSELSKQLAKVEQSLLEKVSKTSDESWQKKTEKQIDLIHEHIQQQKCLTKQSLENDQQQNQCTTENHIQIKQVIIEHFDSLKKEFQEIVDQLCHKDRQLSQRKDQLQNMVLHLSQHLEQLSKQYENWQLEPLARRKDLEQKKVAVFIDFENFLITLSQKKLRIVDFTRFRNFLVDSESKGDLAAERIIIFTNKSRWQRKGFYDKKKNISQHEAHTAKEMLGKNGCRIIESESNIDVPLSLLAIAMAQKGGLDEFRLLGNDSTYAGLIRKLSDLGSIVAGITIGEASGDLLACYKRLGFKLYQLKSEKDFTQAGLAYVEEKGNIGENNHYTETCKNLLAQIRKSRMQFLGAQLQDEVLRGIHHVMLTQQTVEQASLAKLLVEDIFLTLISQQKLSKTKIVGVLNILRRARCFEIIENDQLPPNIRLIQDCHDYDKLREAHDQVFISIANESGFSLSSSEWSLFLYEAPSKTDYFENLLSQFALAERID